MGSQQRRARMQQLISAAGRISKATLAAQVGTAAKPRATFTRNARHAECARSKARDVSSAGPGLFTSDMRNLHCMISSVSTLEGLKCRESPCSVGESVCFLYRQMSAPCQYLRVCC